MNEVGAPERATQNRVVALFRDQLGYEYLGDWTHRDNSNIEQANLRAFLQKQGHSETVIDQAVRKLTGVATLGIGDNFYDCNKKVYGLFRYGVKVREGVGEQHKTVHLIDWETRQNNDFAIAEEVTVKGRNTKRPDIVLYINGIAVGVLELKRSIVSVEEGIRQNLLNQRSDYIRPFFTTIQLVMAGNDTAGLRYGVTGTSAKHFLEWKKGDGNGENNLDRHLTLLCDKKRLLELIRDFVVYDSGIKKICRHNQYFGVKAAQDNIRNREGGIIWHTQGSGKSLTMVWLAKWIRENVTNSRVLIITDRIELDEQIERVFRGVDEAIYRTKSGKDLADTLKRSSEWLISSLVHKFGGASDDDRAQQATAEFLHEMQQGIPHDFVAQGEMFVFVDECHRTQSGAMHKAMKQVLPNAVFIGFTGTPLLKNDKQKSWDVFGKYIHTYKFDEAVADRVVVDLRYESRDINQKIGSTKNIDAWFESKTRGLNDYARDKLKARWAVMQQVLSSESRLKRIVADILLDMGTKPRLASGRGNALLVAGSIFDACKLYKLFAETELAGKCALVTSYRPNPQDIRDEEIGVGTTDTAFQYETYRKMLAKFFDQSPDEAINRADEYEQKVKKLFIEQPGQMRLLIVVDKLLTGFDAPAATYLYIDKSMKDHGLFQAICRVNRVDDDDKEYGYIVDYKDLFRNLERAVDTYTSGAFANYDEQDIAGLLNNRLSKAKERLEQMRESINAHCEPVEAPRQSNQYRRHFCGESVDPEELEKTAQRRHLFYRATASLIRAFAAITGELEEAGYTKKEIKAVNAEVKHYEKVCQEVKMASGDFIDLKSYEPDMRLMIDMYIDADESRTLANFDDIGLVELIVHRGEAAIDKLPAGIRDDKEATAETIENNVRKLIIDERPSNPAYYDKMSDRLDALIKQRRANALNYEDYLKRVIKLAHKVHEGERSVYDETESLPDYEAAEPDGRLDTSEKIALYANFGRDAELALRIDKTVRSSRYDDWRNHPLKTRYMAEKLREVLRGTEYDNDEDAERLLELVKSRREY